MPSYLCLGRFAERTQSQAILYERLDGVRALHARLVNLFNSLRFFGILMAKYT